MTDGPHEPSQPDWAPPSLPTPPSPPLPVSSLPVTPIPPQPSASQPGSEPEPGSVFPRPGAIYPEPGSVPESGSNYGSTPGYPSGMPPGGYPQPGFPPGYQQGYQSQPGYPQPGYPQPGFPGQPGYQPAGYSGYSGTGAVAQKRRKWPYVLLGIIVVFALLIGGCTVAFLRALSPTADEANAFLSDLYVNPTKAATHVCAGVQGFNEQNLARRADALKANGWTGGKNLNSVNMNTSDGTSTGGAGGTLKSLNGRELPVQVMLKKSGKWCVTGFVVDGVSQAADR